MTRSLRRKPSFWLLMSLTVTLFACEDDCTLDLIELGFIPNWVAAFDYPPGTYGEIFGAIPNGLNALSLNPAGVFTPGGVKRTATSSFPIDIISDFVPSRGSAFTAPRFYYTDFTGNRVGSFLLGNNSFGTTTAVGRSPRALVLSPDGRRLYVTNSGSNSISVLDPSTMTVVDTIELPAGTTPYGIAISGNGQRIFVTNNTTNGQVLVVDVASKQVFATMPVGSNPSHIVLSPDDTLAYVVNRGSANLSVIDTLTNTVNRTVNAGTTPTSVLTSLNGRYIYVTNGGPMGGVTVLDSSTYNTLKQIPVGANPNGMTRSHDGQFLFVANMGSNFVTQIDMEQNVAVRNIPSEMNMQTLAYADLR